MNARNPQQVDDSRDAVRVELARAFVLRRSNVCPAELARFIRAADAAFTELAAASRLTSTTHPDFAIAAKDTAEKYSTARMALIRAAMPGGERRPRR